MSKYTTTNPTTGQIEREFPTLQDGEVALRLAGREDEIILRLVLDKPQLASFFPEGTGWTLIIGESVVEPTAPISVARASPM